MQNLQIKSVLAATLFAVGSIAFAADEPSAASKNPNPGPVARAEETTKRVATNTGHAIKNGAKKAGHAVGTGAKKTGDAISRTGEKVQDKTAP